MSSTIETLRRMANEIARNVAVRGHDAAVVATAEHIAKFWDPRMKQAIFADDPSQLSPIAAAAIDRLAAGAEPEAGLTAVERATAQATGACDAG